MTTVGENVDANAVNKKTLTELAVRVFLLTFSC